MNNLKKFLIYDIFMIVLIVDVNLFDYFFDLVSKSGYILVIVLYKKVL